MELKSLEKEYLDKMVEMESSKDKQNIPSDQLQSQIVLHQRNYEEDDADLAHRNEKVPQIVQ